MPKAPITRLSSVSVDASYNTNPGNGAGNGFYVPQLTTTQMNAITPQNGGLIYNTTAGTFYSYDGGWIPLAVAGGGVGGPGTSVVGDIAVFANATGNLIADSGVQITQVPPALASTSLVDVNEIRNLGYIQFTNDTGVILVDAIAAVQFINNDPSTGVLPTTIFNPTLTGSTSVSAVVEIQGSDGVFLMSRLTTAERDLLNQLQPGMLFYNTSLNLLQYRDNTTWQSLSTGGGSSFVFVDTGNASNALFLGIGAGPALPSNYGSFNIALGYETLKLNVDGNFNIAIGSAALKNNINGQYNIAIGASALTVNTVNNNIAIGQNALFNTQVGAVNLAIGYETLYTNIAGGSNIALGYQALYNNTGSSNIAIGGATLYANEGGASNIAVGNGVLGGNKIGNYNTAIGEGALSSSKGDNNVGVGYGSMATNETGSGNICIGTSSDVASSALTNAVAIGPIAIVGASNSMVLGPVGSGFKVGINTTTPLATFHNNGGMALNIIEVVANHAVQPTDHIIGVTGSGGPKLITLPAASAANRGRIVTVKDESGTAGDSPSQNIDINVSGGGDINGSTPFTLNLNYQSASFYSNGTKWFDYIVTTIIH